MARRTNAANSNTVNSPVTGMDAVTPSDTIDLPGGTCRAIWAGVAGNVAIIAADDSAAVTLKGVPAGQWTPVQAKRVMSTNTTATDIVAGY
jgi:hypothetical protein